MRTPVIELREREAAAWAADLAAALRALRLNKQFPPWAPLGATLQALACGGTLRLDDASALPVPREWARARADKPLAAGSRAVGPRKAYLDALAAIDPPEACRIAVALRHEGAGTVGVRATVDRIDAATGAISRYTLLLDGVAPDRVAPGPVGPIATPRFAEELGLLGTVDAALAYAVLRERGLQVDEVVRGTVGPAVWPGRAGPVPGAFGAASRLIVSALLERVSVDLPPGSGHVDDPLPGRSTVPGPAVDFGLTALRKWAAAQDDVPAVQAWLRSRGSRNLVYPY